MKRKLVYGSLVTLLLTGFILNYLLPSIIVQIKHPLLSFREPLTQKELPQGFEEIQVFNKHDGISLSAFYSKSKLDTAKGTVILVHGIRASKEHFIPLAQYLNDKGYNVAALDQRAHGQSEGKYCAFGYYEKHDLLALVDELEKNKSVKRIGVWGQSLGAAVCLQAMAIDKRIKFGIIESTFSDFRLIVNDYIKSSIGDFLPQFIVNYVINRAGIMASFDPDKVKPIESCKAITQPIYMIHGDADKRIKLLYGKNNYEAIPHSEKKFLEVQGGTHLNIWTIGGEKYFEMILAFIEGSVD